MNLSDEVAKGVKDIKKEILQVGFELNKSEKKKLKQVSEYHGLGLSACLRMLIIRAWRDEVNRGK